MGLRLEDIEAVFREHGHIEYSGEGISQLAHALQAAQLAEQEGADDALVSAALLHDLGHLLNRLGDTPSARGLDDQHQYFAIPFLRPLFPAAVVEPIRLHVDAKRALCAIDPAYHDGLSEDSRRSLRLQGGIFSPEDTQTFLAKPFAREAMRVRRWDDAAKVPRAPTPALEHFLQAVARCAIRR